MGLTHINTRAHYGINTHQHQGSLTLVCWCYLSLRDSGAQWSVSVTSLSETMALHRCRRSCRRLCCKGLLCAFLPRLLRLDHWRRCQSFWTYLWPEEQEEETHGNRSAKVTQGQQWCANLHIYHYGPPRYQIGLWPLWKSETGPN